MTRSPSRDGSSPRSRRCPDGRKYFWIATTTPPEGRGYLGQRKGFAIGAGCKICNRAACPQRAFPHLGRRVVVDENAGSGLPYSPVNRQT